MDALRPYGPLLVWAALMILLQWVGPEMLRYDPQAIREGELWRLLSGHLVHANGRHLLLNLTGLLLCQALTGVNWSLWQWSLRILLLALLISLALWFQPRLHWYVGFSGVLFGLYLLADPSGKPLAGNLPHLPEEARRLEQSGWVDFLIRVSTPAGPRTRHVRAYYIRLDEGYHLLIGRDIEHLFQFGRIIRNLLFWVLGLTALLGVGGGLLLSRNFLRRIDGITATVRSIRAGRLARRVPVEGSGDELDRLAEALNDMLDQIERLMQGMREVSSNIAHDLKTPLTRLKAQAEDALRAGDEAHRRAALESTIAQADELLRTFNSLLLIARAEAGQARAGFSEVDVGEVAREIAELYEPLVEEQGGRFTLDVPARARITGDRQLIAQALVNLLDNALKYGRHPDRKPEIAVSVRKAPDMVELVVADNGPGVPEEMREKVKERFVRLDKARSKPGSGLGLSLVASIARLHGGELRLEDNAPGLRAVLRLPVRQDGNGKGARAA